MFARRTVALEFSANDIASMVNDCREPTQIGTLLGCLADGILLREQRDEDWPDMLRHALPQLSNVSLDVLVVVCNELKLALIEEQRIRHDDSLTVLTAQSPDL